MNMTCDMSPCMGACSYSPHVHFSPMCFHSCAKGVHASNASPHATLFWSTPFHGLKPCSAHACMCSMCCALIHQELTYMHVSCALTHSQRMSLCVPMKHEHVMTCAFTHSWHVHMKHDHVTSCHGIHFKSFHSGFMFTFHSGFMFTHSLTHFIACRNQARSGPQFVVRWVVCCGAEGWATEGL